MAEAKNDAKKLLDEQDKARQESNKAAEDAMNNSQPTPTQRENDLARLGALDIDKKEPDGTEVRSETVVANRSISTATPAPTVLKKD